MHKKNICFPGIFYQHKLGSEIQIVSFWDAPVSDPLICLESRRLGESCRPVLQYQSPKLLVLWFVQMRLSHIWVLPSHSAGMGCQMGPSLNISQWSNSKMKTKILKLSKMSVLCEVWSWCQLQGGGSSEDQSCSGVDWSGHDSAVWRLARTEQLLCCSLRITLQHSNSHFLQTIVKNVTLQRVSNSTSLFWPQKCCFQLLLSGCG